MGKKLPAFDDFIYMLKMSFILSESFFFSFSCIDLFSLFLECNYYLENVLEMNIDHILETYTQKNVE